MWRSRHDFDADFEEAPALVARGLILVRAKRESRRVAGYLDPDFARFGVGLWLQPAAVAGVGADLQRAVLEKRRGEPAR